MEVGHCETLTRGLAELESRGEGVQAETRERLAKLQRDMELVTERHACKDRSNLADAARLFEMQLREVQCSLSAKANTASVDAMRKDIEQFKEQFRAQTDAMRHKQQADSHDLHDGDHTCDVGTPHCLACGRMRSPSPPLVLQGTDGMAYGFPTPEARHPIVWLRPRTPPVLPAQVSPSLSQSGTGVERRSDPAARPPSSDSTSAATTTGAGPAATPGRSGRRAVGAPEGAEAATPQRALISRSSSGQTPLLRAERRPPSARTSSAGSSAERLPSNLPIRAYLSQAASLPGIGRGGQEASRDAR